MARKLSRRIFLRGAMAGWCRRNADSCDPEDCTPGPPNVESCNAFDDDCDGLIDEELRCDGGDAGPSIFRRDAGLEAPEGGSGGCAAGGGGGGLALVSLGLFALARRRRSGRG